MTQTRLRPSIVAGSVCLTAFLAAGQWQIPGVRLDDSHPAGFIIDIVVGSFATVGVPVAAYLRYRIISPVLILVMNTGFWASVFYPGDAAGSVFAVALWPVSVTAYALFGTLERRMRRRLERS